MILPKYWRRFTILISVAVLLTACSSSFLISLFRLEAISLLELHNEQITYLDKLIDDTKPAIVEVLATNASNRTLSVALFKSKKNITAEDLLSFSEEYIKIFQLRMTSISSSFADFYNQLSVEQREKLHTLIQQLQSKARSESKHHSFQKKYLTSYAERIRRKFIALFVIEDKSPQMRKLSTFVENSLKTSQTAFDLNLQQKKIWRDALQQKQDIKSDFLVSVIKPYVEFYHLHKTESTQFFVEFYNSLDAKQREKLANDDNPLRLLYI